MAKRRAKSKESEATEAPLLPAELPEGWAVATLGDDLVVEVTPGFACGAHSRDTADVSHLRPMNVNSDGRIDLGNVKYVPAPAAVKANKWLERGDVLFNNTNSAELVGKTAYYDRDERLAFSNHMTRVRVRTDGLDPRYCAFYLHANWRAGDFQARCNQHVSQASIGREVLLDTPIPVPPLAEQKRIADRIETLLKNVDAARDRLAKVPDILKRFRQSILAAACSGRLTEDWRERNSSEKTGSMLSGELGSRSTERGPRRKTRTNGDDDTPPNDLPDTWTWIRLENLCEAVVDCPHSTPKWTTSGHLCARTTNFRPGLLDLSEKHYVSPSTYLVRVARLKPRPHDVLYSREGGILGIACMVPPDTELCLGQRMMLLRPWREVTPAFLMNCLNSPAIVAVVRELTGGTASPHLNVGDVKRFWVPLPPTNEQREIVHRVEALIRLCDTVERTVLAADERAKTLAQSVLSKAFSGELLPTEAELAGIDGRDYESAPALLARIRADSVVPHTVPPAARSRVSPKAIAAATRAAPTSPLSRKRAHSSTIFYKRAAVAAYIIDRLHTRPTFGRVQLEKCLYLAEAYVGVDLEGDFKRAAAGPLDAEYLYKLESAAHKNGWFVKRTIAGDKPRHTYHPGAKSAQLLGAAEKYLGAGKAKMDFLLGWMEKFATERAEIVATLFAAWSDLLRAGHAVTDDAIITEVRENWHESKSRFEPDRLRAALGLMRQHALVPPAPDA